MASRRAQRARLEMVMGACTFFALAFAAMAVVQWFTPEPSLWPSLGALVALAGLGLAYLAWRKH